MHITITGKLGSGKSTVAKKLVELYGFEIFSTGAILRAANAASINSVPEPQQGSNTCCAKRALERSTIAAANVSFSGAPPA